MSANRVLFSKFQFLRLIELEHSVLYEVAKADQSNSFLQKVCSDIEPAAGRIIEANSVKQPEKLAAAYKAFVVSLKSQQQLLQKEIDEIEDTDPLHLCHATEIYINQMKAAQTAFDFVLKSHLLPPFDPVTKPLLINKLEFKKKIEEIILERQMLNFLDKLNKKFSPLMKPNERMKLVDGIVERIKRFKLWRYPHFKKQYVDAMVKLIDSTNDREELVRYHAQVNEILTLNALIHAVYGICLRESIVEKSILEAKGDKILRAIRNEISYACILCMQGMKEKLVKFGVKFKTIEPIKQTLVPVADIAVKDKKQDLPEETKPAAIQPIAKTRSLDSAPDLKKEKEYLLQLYKVLEENLKIKVDENKQGEDWYYQIGDDEQPSAFISRQFDLRPFITDREQLVRNEDSISSLQEVKEKIIEPIQNMIGLNFEVVLALEDDSYEIVEQNRINEEWHRRAINVRLIVKVDDVTNKLQELESTQTSKTRGFLKRAISMT